MSDQDRLAEIKARRAKITSPPWRWEDCDTDEIVTNPATRQPWGRVSLRTAWTSPYTSIPGEGPVFVLDTVEIEGDEQDDANAVFITHAPEDIDWLVAEVERLRGEDRRR